MRLVLCSEGFHTPNTVQACVNLVGKPQNEVSFAVINEAYAVEHGDKRWVLKNLHDIASNFSGEIDLINLLALSIDEVKKSIAQRDVIFVIGGNTDYLMSVFIKTGFDKILPEFLKTKVYVGSSAGSIVIGKKLSPQAYKGLYKNRNEFGTTKYLELVDLAIIPHLDSAHFVGRKETLQRVAPKHDGVIYGLNDDSAVVVKNDVITTIGSQPTIFNG